jgi:hypothetical protein
MYSDLSRFLAALHLMFPYAPILAPFKSLDSGGPDAIFTGQEQIIEGIFESLSALNQVGSEDAG